MYNVHTTAIKIHTTLRNRVYDKKPLKPGVARLFSQKRVYKSYTRFLYPVSLKKMYENAHFINFKKLQIQHFCEKRKC